MQEIAEFQKVSFRQFLEDSKKTGFVSDEVDQVTIKLLYDAIKLPTRATKGSAGYDFYLPYPFYICGGRFVTIPTGIRVIMQPGWFLSLVPRSSLGFKYGMRLLNTIGCVDADFSEAENEGHIMARITVEGNMCLREGDRFMQGILIPHGIAKMDAPLTEERTGGIGSTGA